MLIQAGLTFAVNAAFPRVAYWLRWPTRLRGGPLLAYVAWNIPVVFSFRQWVVPIFREAAAEMDAATEELRVELGREPIKDEVGERIAAKHGWTTSPLMPDPR